VSAAYGKIFFEWANLAGKRSAIALLPLVKELVHPRNVLDVGCAHGSWLVVWSELGVEDCVGLDGYHVDRRSLLIPPGRFQAADLSKSFNVGRRLRNTCPLAAPKSLWVVYVRMVMLFCSPRRSRGRVV